KLVTKIIPGEERIIEYDPSHLDVRLLQGVPSVALDQARVEIAQMGDFVKEEFNAAFEHYQNQDQESKEDTIRLEEVVNQIDFNLTQYLMLVAEQDLTETLSNEQAEMMDVTKYLERIGDHCENIVKNIQEAIQMAKKDAKNNKNVEST